MLPAHSDSTVDTWNKKASALLAYELLPFWAEPDSGPHCNSLRYLDVPLGERWVGFYRLSGES